MISTLHIKNIGIIEDLNINLNEGLNVFTGETGAGKTLIIDSLEIICGGRFSKEMIRKGENHSYVELSMYLPENENSIEGNIIVSREIFQNGRNTCKINGRLVTVTELKTFMQKLIDIHGQNDSQKLLDSTSHIRYLDLFIGEKISKNKNDYLKFYERYKEIQDELKENYGDEKEKQRRLDLLKYQLEEIENANLKESEEESLEEDRKKILNAEKIAENINEADYAIGEIAIDSINASIKALEKIEDLDKKYSNSVNSLRSLYYELQEISRDLSDYKEETYFDEDKRNEIEMRLDLIYSLKRKYGNNIKEILEYKEEVRCEIDKIENSEEYVNKLKKEKKELKVKMIELTKKMDEIRKEAALKLDSKINNELIDLEMPNAKFRIFVEYNEGEFNKNGANKVEFLISTNKGEEEKELVKIASGGELSRIILSIKTVLAGVDEVPCMIFDEIDTGISGKAANAVATKISKIAKIHQVICVSHLAALAAKADYNYFIHKQTKNERTSTNVKLLKEKEVLEEIARISSGEITKTALEHAAELRNRRAS